MTRTDRWSGFSPLRFVVALLMTGCSLLVTISADIENREWTPPYPWPTAVLKTTTVPTTWTMGYGIRKTTTGRTTIGTTAATTRQTSICEIENCICDAEKTRIECRRSPLTEVFQLGQQIRLPAETRVVILSGFRQLKLYKNCMESLTNLKMVIIENVEEIQTESFALSQPLCNSTTWRDWRDPSRPTLIINGSSIDHLTTRTFTGAWHEIVIINSKLKRTEKESFYQLNCLNKLILDKNNITNIESRTIHGGLTHFFKMKNNQIRCIKNNAFDLNVTDSAHIHYNHFADIQSEAFALYSPRSFVFRENTVGILYTHAFKLEATEKIEINSSSFNKVTRHALHKIRVANEAKVTFKLSLKDFDKGAFDLDESLSVTALQLVDIQFDWECDCSDLQVRIEGLFSDAVVDPSSSDGASVKSIFQDSVSCNVKNGTEKVYVFTRSHHCQAQGSVQVANKAPNVVMIASIACTSIVFFVLGIIIAATVTVRKREKLRQGNLETQKNFVMHVYTETECKVEEEYAFPLETLNEH